MQHSQDIESKVQLAVQEFARKTKSGGDALTDMSMLIDVTTLLPLSRLDYWERFIRLEFCTLLRTQSSPCWKIWSKPSQANTWIDLISWDGHKREKALQTLSSAAPNAFFFALIVRRLNDWVPEVRKAARERIPQIVDASNPSFIVEALCVTLMHWNSWGRMDSPERKALLNILDRKEIAQTFMNKLVSSTSGPMMSILAQVGRTSTIDIHLKNIAKNAIQPSVRAKAFRSLLEGKMTWLEGREWKWSDLRFCQGQLKPIVSERDLLVKNHFMESLKLASTDRSSLVRKVAAEILITNLNTVGVESLALARVFAADRSTSIAERGQFMLNLLENPK